MSPERESNGEGYLIGRKSHAQLENNLTNGRVGPFKSSVAESFVSKPESLESGELSGS